MFPLLRSSHDKVRPHPELPSFISGNKKSDKRRRGNTQGEQGGNKEVRGGTQRVGGEREKDEGGETAVFWSPAVLCFGP